MQLSALGKWISNLCRYGFWILTTTLIEIFMLTIHSTPHGQLSTRHQPSEIPQIQHHLLPNKAFNKKANLNLGAAWLWTGIMRAGIQVRHAELWWFMCPSWQKVQGEVRESTLRTTSKAVTWCLSLRGLCRAQQSRPDVSSIMTEVVQ